MTIAPIALAHADPGALDRALRHGPFDAALRAAIVASGLSLDRLRTKLAERGMPVGITTLSYWQRGLRRPERAESLRAVAMLEQILGLPDRSLIVLLGPPRPRGGPNRGMPRFTELIKAPDALDALLADLDSPAAGRLQVVSQYDKVTVNAAGAIGCIDTTSVVSAPAGGVDRALVIYTVETGECAQRVTIVPGDSCRVGRTVACPVAQARVAEVLFDRRLGQNDTHMMSYRIQVNEDSRAHEHVTGFRLPATHYVLRVAFDPGMLPVRMRRFVARDARAPEEDIAELTLDSHHSVHLVANDVRPGVVGIRWDWS
jgi:hypothetical protein